jgi:GNAT superfamily N-acetyltransferase
MTSLATRCASPADVPAMARLRDASGWTGGADETTMRRYLSGEHHPREALAPRVAFVAEADVVITGFVAGHLTRRFACDGELQWILVAPEERGTPTAGRLLRALATWFVAHDAARVCVNVAPENDAARRFYARHGATDLSEQWMVWTDIASAISSDDR